MVTGCKRLRQGRNCGNTESVWMMVAPLTKMGCIERAVPAAKPANSVSKHVVFEVFVGHLGL